MQREYHNITNFIKINRIRLLIKSVLFEIAWASALVVAMLLTAPVVLKLMPYPYAAGIFIAGVFIIFLFCIRFIFSIKRALRYSSLYAELKCLLSESAADDLMSAIELGQLDDDPPHVSADLIGSHVKKMASMLSANGNKIPFVEKRTASLLKLAGVLILLILAVDAGTGAWRNAYKIVRDSFAGIYGRDGIVKSIEITYMFPAYTGLSQKTYKNTDGNIYALKGSIAEISVVVPEGTSAVSMVFDNGESVAMDGAEGRFTGKAPVVEPRNYFFELKRKTRKHRDGALRSISPEEDAYPSVEAVQITRGEELTYDSNILLSYNASDDFGVKKITLVYEKDGKRAEIGIKEGRSNEKTLKGEYLWPLREYGLKKGDEANLWFEVMDNDAVSGPKISSSQKIPLRITGSDRMESLLENVKALFEEMLDALAEILEGNENLSRKKFWTDLSGRFENILQSARKIRQSMPDTQNRALDLLNKIVSDLNTGMAEINAFIASNAGRKNNPSDLIIQAMESDILELNNILRLGLLEFAVGKWERLMEQQQSLLDRFKKGMENDLLSGIQDIERAISALLSDIAGSIGNFSADFINRDALGNVSMDTMLPKLKDVQELLKQGRIEEAKKLYQEFLQEYTKMLASMREMLNSAAVKSMANLSAELSEIRSRIADIEKEQKSALDKMREAGPEIERSIRLNDEIIKDMEGLLKNSTPEISPIARKNIQEFSERENKAGEHTRKLIGKVQELQASNKGMNTPLPGMLSGAADFMKGSEERLKNNDLPGGISNAAEAHRRLGEAKDFIDEMQKGGMPMTLPVFGMMPQSYGYGGITGRVELPGEQESQFEKKLRDELLKAMRSGLPERFKEENKRYYEELLK
ncbi:MAG TPA: DUF4175 family protein [bacterium]